MKKEIKKPKKKTNKKMIKELKKSVKKVANEWNKAFDALQDFDPMENFEMPDFEKQFKDFKIDGEVNI